MRAFSSICGACGWYCCGCSCCIRPIDCPNRCIYLFCEIIKLLTAHELRAINLHGLFLNVNREIKPLKAFGARSIRAYDVHHAFFAIEACINQWLTGAVRR